MTANKLAMEAEWWDSAHVANAASRNQNL